MSISTAESEAVEGCAPSLLAHGRVPDICLATICRSSACSTHPCSDEGQSDIDLFEKPNH